MVHLVVKAGSVQSVVGFVQVQGKNIEGGYMAYGILLVRSVNESGNGVLLNRIWFNRIPFLFIYVKPNLPASINHQQH